MRQEGSRDARHRRGQDVKTPKTTTGGDRPATTDADALNPDALNPDALHTDGPGPDPSGSDTLAADTLGSGTPGPDVSGTDALTPDADLGPVGSDADRASRPEIRRIPAHVGVIPSTETGTGTPAQAGQPGEVTPIDSTLVGAGGAWAPASPGSDVPPTGSADSATDGRATDDALRGDTRSHDAFRADTLSHDATGDRSGRGSDAASAPPFGAAQGRDDKAPAPARRGGFWPLALGGAVAAGLGAAATLYALPHLPPEWRPAGGAETAMPGAADLPDRETLMAEAAQAGRQAAEEVLARSGTNVAPSDSTAAGAETDQPQDSAQGPAQDLPQDLAARLEALERQLPQDGVPQDGAPQDDAAEARLAELVQRLDDQQSRLDELAARPAFDPEAAGALEDQIQTAAAEARSALDEVRAQTQELQDAAEDSTRRAEAVAAIAALQGALDAGVTPEEARTALEGVGLEAPEALQTPVPALTDLQSEFPEAARAALRASLRETSASGEGNLFTNFLRAQTGARSVAPREGDDPDAILSRADAEVQAGRIDAALTEARALPEPARAAPAMAQWLERATAYSQARSALSDLSSGTN